MNLLRLDQICIEFGDNPLLVNANLVVEPEERICLIGRNGAGKSTLLKIISGVIEPDRGEIQYRQNLRISKLEQQLPGDLHRKVEDVVREGLAEQQARIRNYETLSQAGTADQNLNEIEALQLEIEASGGWNLDQRVETIISQLGLPAGKRLDQLSGGWQRRVGLGKALVSNPELLLLDEPTNHLDFSTIEWLEHHIRGYRGAVIFVTHDRAFIHKLSSRIVEIDRGQLISWLGDYKNYLKLKEKSLEEEETRNALFDKRLAEEEAWIREGVKARRTRNEGRVRSLHAMRQERMKRIKRQGRAKIHVEEGEQSGRKVIEARSIQQGFDGHKLIDGLSMKVMRGDRIGLIGNNGVGKSTLLKILLGQIQPDSGSVKLGTNLQVAYFDQVKQDIDLDRTVAENVGQGREYISVNGKDRHVISYLRNFLFSPKKAMTKVRQLSGGERNRVMLAKLFSQPSNLLVLDEPTNDLDVEMLEALEEQLVEYQGTLIVVSHDREFLDNVVTSVVAFESNNHVQEYVGGFSDWLRRGHQLSVTDDLNRSKAAETEVSESPAARKSSVKLSYKYQRELDQLPEKIERLERELDALQQQISDPTFYERDFVETEPVMNELKAKQASLDEATERWMELEEMALK